MSEHRTGQDTVVQENSATHGHDKKLSEIKIVLIGCRNFEAIEASGKSSVGNLILGRDAFKIGRTAQSVQATREIHGRHITVVDTPSWYYHYPLEEIPKFDRLEIIKSPTLCSPGPHAFLVVIPVDLVFPKTYEMENLLDFFFKDVWRYVIVLFSSIAPHDNATLISNLRKSADLSRLLLKCQNRCHVLNINNRNDSFQVIRLLEKIEDMIAQNNGQYFISTRDLHMEVRREEVTRVKSEQRFLAVMRQRAELRERIRAKEQYLTDIRIVLLGVTWFARSSAGNIILGKEVFKTGRYRTTVSCEVGHAEVHGKQLTVVDTPGWYYNRPTEKTPVMDKLEIKSSVCLCPPGPHAILLIVPIDTAYSKSSHTFVEHHMSLLGKEVWRHTIVLFTFGDWLGDTTIEERIEKEGEHLEWLMEQCGNRYHVFNCKNPTDTSQVTELFEKIEEMVMQNNVCYYVPETDLSIELELKLKTAKTNKMKVARQRDILHELLKERKYSLSEVRIVLLGAEDVGKRKLGNIILQGNLFNTTMKKTKTSQCEMKQRNVEGIQVSVVATPGWSTSTLKDAKEILRSVSVCSPGPHAFLLVLPVDESYTQKAQQSVEELMSLFGESVFRYTVILFTDGYWWKDRPIEEYIACEGEALQRLIRNCGNRYYVLTDYRCKVQNLLKMIEEMVARNRGECFTLAKKASQGTVFQRIRQLKTLTEEEWNKREDELIERMLKAAVVDLDAEESKHPSARRRQSFDRIIPSMSGESLSDNASIFGADIFHSAVKVSQWLRHLRSNAASSGYDTMSTTSRSHNPMLESVKDYIPNCRHPSTNTDSLDCGANIRAQKHARSSSI